MAQFLRLILASIGTLAFCVLAYYLVRYSNNLEVSFLIMVCWLGFTLALFVIKKNKRYLDLIYVKEESPWASRLSGGWIMFSLRTLVALPMAVLFLLSVSVGLSPDQWVMTAILIFGWVLVFYLVNRWATKHIKDQAQQYFSAKISQLLLATISIIIFASYSFYVVELPDLSGFSVDEAYWYGSKIISEQPPVRSDVILVGLAFASGINHVLLWFVERFTQLETNAWVNIVVWLAYALKSALFAIPIFWLLRALTLLQSEEKILTVRLVKNSAYAFAFIFVSLSISISFIAPQVTHLWQETRCIALDNEDVCYVVTSRELQDAIDKAAKKLTPAQTKVAQQMANESTEKLKELFSQANDKVDEYIDWHYSLTGKTVWLFSNASEELDKRLFNSQGLKASYKALAEQVANELESQNAQFISDMKEEVKSKLYNQPQKSEANAVPLNLEASIEKFQEIYRREQEKAIAQLAAAATTGAVAAKATLEFGKQNAKQTGKQAAKQAAKVAGKRAVGAGAAAPCLLTGPWAPVCAVGVFVTTTFVMEFAEIKIDKALNKEQLKQEIIEWLEITEQGLKDELRLRIINSFPRSYEELSKQVAGQEFSTIKEKLEKKVD